MAQVTDRTIGANPTGFDMRTELNNIIAALESDNSGSSEPLNPVAYIKWLDTSNATYYYYKERNHDNTAWVTLFRYTVATKIMEVVSNGVVLSQTDIASEIHASSSKTTPVDADEIGLIDSASTFTLKKLTWSNLKATLKTYFDTLYVALSGNQTIAGIKTFSSSPIAPTPTAGDNSTKVATTAFVKTAIDNSLANNRQIVSVYRSGTQSLSAGTYTKIQFNAEESDTNNIFDSVTNYRYQPTEAGWYRVGGGFSISTNTTLLLSVYKNGAQYKLLNSASQYSSTAEGSCLVYLNGATDYIELYGFSVSASTIDNSQTNVYFQAIKL